MILEELSIPDITGQGVYRLVTRNIHHFETSIILKIDAPLAAADVRKPDRSE
jgi:hypothetical protein